MDEELFENELELRVVDLEGDGIQPGNEVAANDLPTGFEMKLLDIRFILGSHIERDLNSSHYIQPWNLS